MKKLLRVFVVAGLFFACCTMAEAANWVLAGTSEDGNASLYVDKESIKSSPQNVTMAWTKFLFGNPESFESKMFSQMLVYMEYGCNEKKTRMLELTFYYTDGSQETFSPAREWRSVKPGTLENESFQYLCR